MDDIIITCACGEHKHLLSEKEHCQQCHEIEEELKNDMEYQQLLKKYKRNSK